MQHFPLLTEIGRAGLPVLLKRGMGASVDDFLLAAEYILTEGNPHVVLCERGIHANATPARSCLDLAAVTVLKEHTHLPVIVDPSHAAGRRALVEPLALAAAACGADGLIVECHPNPSAARCDGPQAITLDVLPAFSERIRRVAGAAAA
jgi:3-deoxy-7-phosphoheptulonate synthase